MHFTYKELCLLSEAASAYDFSGVSPDSQVLVRSMLGKINQELRVRTSLQSRSIDGTLHLSKGLIVV